MKKRTRQQRNDNELMRDVAANVAEHFTDYIVIGRVKDGLVWRQSDRTFTVGACTRVIEHIKNDDSYSQSDD